MAICPYHAIPQAALDAPFTRFTPAALKSLWHPKGVGGLGYGWGSGKSGIWIKAFLYVMFLKKKVQTSKFWIDYHNPLPPNPPKTRNPELSLITHPVHTCDMFLFIHQ